MEECIAASKRLGSKIVVTAASSGCSLSGALKLVGAQWWELKVDESELHKASSTVGDTVEGSWLAARKGLVVYGDG